MSILISIIIPTYNSGETITDCLNSLIGQTENNYEIIVVDNVSTDKTPEIVRHYQTKCNAISLISEKDKGIYDAMNKGINASNGDYLIFLGSDDELYSNTVLSEVKPHLYSKKYDVVYGNVLRKHSKIKYNGKYNKYKILNKNICHQAIFYKRDMFKKLGEYNIQYRSLADWDFNMKWFPRPDIKRKYIPNIISIYNENGDGSNTVDKSFHADFEKNILKYNSSIFNFFYKYRRNTVFGKINRVILRNL